MSEFTAVYGGSFDPVHIGHVMLVSHLLLNHPEVKKILVVPCFNQVGKSLSPYHYRVRMCEEAFGWLPVEVSDIEAELQDDNSITMLRALADRGETNLRFVMGSDLMFSYKKWPGWEDIEKLAPPLFIGRAGIAPVSEGDPTPISPAMSSSIVREALANKDYQKAWRYLPAPVLKYIRETGLYGCSPELHSRLV